MGILGRIILLVCDISPRHGSVNADQEDIIISVKKFGDVFIFSYLYRINKKEKLINIIKGYMMRDILNYLLKNNYIK